MCRGRSSMYTVCCTRGAFRIRSEAAGETDGRGCGSGCALLLLLVFARPSLTLRADDSCCKPGRALLAADGFVMRTLAQRRLAARALDAAHHHVGHVAAVPVPGFLRFRGSHHRKRLLRGGVTKRRTRVACGCAVESEFGLTLEDNTQLKHGQDFSICTNSKSNFPLFWFYIDFSFFRRAFSCSIFAFQHIKTFQTPYVSVLKMLTLPL